jgi:glycosyltransferase involved in cell wall biosynthesis
MNLLFIHQNMPGQFRHLIPALAAGPHRIVCVSRRPEFAPPGVGRVIYQVPGAAPDSPHTAPAAGMHPFLAPADAAVWHGQAVAQACDILARNGLRPDLVVAHPGWGESLFVKQVFPHAPLLHYCEWYYRPHGADSNFDPADQQSLDGDCAIVTRNAHLLLALETCDVGMSPTNWQKHQHPTPYHPKIAVRFDGVDTDAAAPDLSARFALADGRMLAAGDPVVTYVARSLEPYRGFPSFMRALPLILARHPTAQVLIAGGDDVSYGTRPPEGGTWRDALLRQVAIDSARVHFLGRISRDAYLRLLQVSAAHVYLTVPFVLSWSMLEAMAAGCLVIGSATPPVQEVIEHGRNGLLADFFNSEMIAEHVLDALRRPEAFETMRQAARWTALSRYSLARCLTRQLDLLQDVQSGRQPALE